MLLRSRARLRCAILHYDIGTIRHLVEVRRCKVYISDLDYATKLGRLHVIRYFMFGTPKWWHEARHKNNEPALLVNFTIAGSNGHLNFFNYFDKLRPKLFDAIDLGFHEASQNGHFQIVEFYVNKGRALPESSLYDAVCNENAAWIEHLHQHGFPLRHDASVHNINAYRHAFNSTSDSSVIPCLYKYGTLLECLNMIRNRLPTPAPVNVVELPAITNSYELFEQFIQEGVTPESMLRSIVAYDRLDMTLNLYYKHLVPIGVDILFLAAYCDAIKILNSFMGVVPWNTVTNVLHCFKQSILGGAMRVFDFFIDYFLQNYRELNLYYDDLHDLLEFTAFSTNFVCKNHQKSMYRKIVIFWKQISVDDVFTYFWDQNGYGDVHFQLRWVKDIVDFSVWDKIGVCMHPKLSAFCRLTHNMERWRRTVTWMNRVRPCAWHWYEMYQVATCAPNGKGRKRDREAFERDMLSHAVR